MLRSANTAFLSALLVIFLVTLGSAQVVTGVPPFASTGGGPFDSINLGNLNVHFPIPIIHKAGRGIPFDYDLSYDNSIWYPVSNSGVLTWSNVKKPRRLPRSRSVLRPSSNLFIQNPPHPQNDGSRLDSS